MKQLFLTSMAILAISCPAFANIDKDASSATCDSATIGTTTGPANLQADWTANTINLDWYSNDSKLTVGSSSATCTYDNSITLPSTPTVPTGYTFGGWKVRQTSNTQVVAQCINTNWVPDEEKIVDAGWVTSGEYGNKDTNKYNLTSNGDYAIEFSDALIKGTAVCNDITSNTFINAFTQLDEQTITEEQFASIVWGNNNSDAIRTDVSFNQNSTGANCWCRLTNFNDNTCPITKTPWVYGAYAENETKCNNWCAVEVCGNMMLVFSEFANALLGRTN